jgi:CubicO group peptidase (beta-lactamase class C family)
MKQRGIPNQRLLLGWILLAVVASTACTSGGSASPEHEDQAPSPARSTASESAEQAVRKFIDDSWPRGASGTVIAARGRDLLICTGLGMADRKAQVPADCDTVYDIMSMTKQFTAAGILKLEMMGKLQVSDSISEFLGPVPDDKSDITLHHLLTHTAGLTDGLGGDYEAVSREEMLDAALRSELRSRPGSEYFYSNLGYSVLAAIIEKVSGMGYEEFLNENVFAPAGMTQTGYVLPDRDLEQVAVEYDEDGKTMGRPFDHPWADDGPYWNLRGNGGMLSTARDMFRWHVALEGDAILDRSAKDKLFKPYVLEEEGGDTHYGYGWVVLSTPAGRAVWHNGGNGWSYGEIARFSGGDVMVFWVSNRAYKAKDWNMERLDGNLTLGIAERARDPG